MFETLYRFIWAHSRRAQLATLALTIASLPLLYLSLQLPKWIVNGAIAGEAWPQVVGGVSFGQLRYLLVLCFAFLVVVGLNAFFRHRVNLRKAEISIDLLSQLREQLMARFLELPMSQFKRMAPGEVSAIVVAEVLPFGRFFGDAFAVPVFEGARLLTILAFVFLQDPRLGLAAGALIPLQAYLIPRLQRRVNELTEEVVVHERHLASRITEVVDGVRDIRSNGGAGHVLRGLRARLSVLAVRRIAIADRQSLIALVNAILAALTPFFFYVVGGWLVIEDELSFGALVAALAAYHDLSDPWQDLLSYYRAQAEARTQFDTIRARFGAVDAQEAPATRSSPSDVPHLRGAIEVVDVALVDEEGERLIEHVAFRIEPRERILILSEEPRVREATAGLLARLSPPSSGRISIGDRDLAELSDEVCGARIAFLDGEPSLFDATVGENLYLGLARGAESGATSDAHAVANLRASQQPWIDPGAARVESADALEASAVEIARRFELEEDLCALGLRVHSPVPLDPSFERECVAARSEIRDRLAALNLEDLVQPFDPDQFNAHISLAENILFGAARGDGIDTASLTGDPVLRRLLAEHRLEELILEVGLQAAEALIDLFSALPPGHAFFEQYNLVSEQEIPELGRAVRVARNRGHNALDPDLKVALLNVAMGLVPQRHRLGSFDEGLRARIVALRKACQGANRPPCAAGFVPYESGAYNPELDLLSNLLFGRVVFSRTRGIPRVMEVVDEVTRDRGLRARIAARGLEAEVGVAGRRLSDATRQKLCVARSLIKAPDLIVANDPLRSLDRTSRMRLYARILDADPEATHVWIAAEAPPELAFDRVLSLRGGRIAENRDGRERVTASPSATPEANASSDGALSEEMSALRSVPFLASLDWAHLKLLAVTGQREEYEPGETLFSAGESGTAAYVILSGRAEVLVGGPEAGDALYVLGEGQMIGELAMLRDTVRSATVRAETKVDVLRLDREVFFETVREDSAFAFEIARDLAGRLVDTTARIGVREDEPASDGLPGDEG